MSEPAGRGGRLRAALGLAALALAGGLVAFGLLAGGGHGHLPAPGAGPDPAAARAAPARLAEHVLARLYAAFGEREEAAIYDALAKVAEGEVLESLYLEKRAALLDPASGASGQSLHGIEVTEAALSERAGVFEIAARWHAIGAVEHGDHVHVRGNAYAAQLRLVPRAEGWRLTGFDLLDIERQAVE